MRDKLNCDISPAEYEMIFERLLERGEIPVSENPSYENELIINKKVYAEYNRLKMIDIETMSKYRIGDRIRDIDTGRAGTIVGIWMDRFVIHYYDDDDNRSIEYAGDIEFLDKKQTFLERLQGLLRDFDASIESGAEGSEISWIDLYFDKDHAACFDYDENSLCAKITADNILKNSKK